MRWLCVLVAVGVSTSLGNWKTAPEGVSFCKADFNWTHCVKAIASDRDDIPLRASFDNSTSFAEIVGEKENVLVRWLS